MSEYYDEPKQAPTSGLQSYSTGNVAVGGYGTNTLPAASSNQRRSRTIIIAAATFLLLILLLLFFFPRPIATIVLTPTSTTLNTSTTVSVLAHRLSSHQQDSKAGVPSGPIQQGTHATGALTFYNYTPNWITIPANTVITNNAGEKVVTDRALSIPPDPPLIPGVASVSAHAVNAGKSGNISTMSINGSCCTNGVTVSNQSAFSGGADGQKMHTVQQSDIDSITNDLKASLLVKAQNDIRAHLLANETLVNAQLHCIPENVVSSPSLGTGATNFTVSLSLTCSAFAYNPQAAINAAQQQLQQQAAKKLDPGFVLVNTIVATTKQATVNNNGTVNVLAEASGTWKYQFSAARKSEIAQHITRMTTDNAKAWLLQQTGVTQASVTVSGPIIHLFGNATLPDDLRSITING